jgi:hypothetical protein
MRRFMQMMAGLKLRPSTAKEAMDAIVQPPAGGSVKHEPKHLERLAEYQRNLRALKAMLDEPVTRSRVWSEASPQLAAERESDAGEAAESLQEQYSASFASSRSLSGREEAVEAVEVEPKREPPRQSVPMESRHSFADVDSPRLRRPSDGSVSSSNITDVFYATEL